MLDDESFIRDIAIWSSAKTFFALGDGPEAECWGDVKKLINGERK
jgi:hypothetical protein